MSVIDTLLAHSALPDDSPMGMPGAFYTDPALFELERFGVLSRGWHCIGRADELLNPGDYFALDLLGEPLLAVRNDDGEIAVMSNVCRHRGMPLAEGRGSAKRFVCSYHAWTYGRDGALLRAPRMQNAIFDQKNCRLPRYNSQEWMGFLYVNLYDAAAPFEHPELNKLLRPFETGTFRLVHVEEEVWKTNWKCLVENFMEGYHLSVVHPQTLHGYTPTGLSRKLAGGGGFTSYAANYPTDIAPRGLGAKGLTEEERGRSTLFSIFPCQVASQAASLLVSLSLLPEAVNATRVKWTMSVYGDDLHDAVVEERVRLWQDVNREDREKLERLQIALGSRHAHAGPLAGDDMEGTIRDFHLWLAKEAEL